MDQTASRRILIIDDNEDIHEDFQKILGGSDASSSEGLQNARNAFLGGDAAPAAKGGPEFQIGKAYQGEEGIEQLETAIADGDPYALAFVDVRMPPGMDGIQTIKRLWDVDDDLQVVICTAFADYSFEEIIDQLGDSDRLLILKKPFDPVEVRQLAGSLTEKWQGIHREREKMTALKAAEREARERATELEETNRALEEANERAQAASEAKSNFLANMSHEIRTPMNSILGYVDLLCESEVPEGERKKYAEIIRQSGEHLLTILNDVLDISKIEAGRMTQRATDFVPFDLTREVVTLMHSAALEKDLGLGLEIPAEIPVTFRSDPVRVRQILLNLIGNAIKFTRAGSVRVVVGIEEHSDPSLAQLRFDVIDSGIGIEPTNLAAIFDAFSQIDSSSTRRAGGTGLGLAISKRLALMLGGDIEVRSELDKGSVFTLRLPLGEAVEAEREGYSPDQLNLASEHVSRKADAGRLEKRVLLVEDVAFNQFLLSTVLKKAGAEVEVADNGQIGCEKVVEAQAAGTPFDLVLMDMQMPVMDGYAATAKLRADGFDLPVIALTAHAMSGDRAKCIDAGCTDYTTKPIDRRVLLELCRSLTDANGSADPPAALPSTPESARTPEEADS